MLRLQEVLVLFCPFDQRRVSKVAQPRNPPSIESREARASESRAAAVVLGFPIGDLGMSEKIFGLLVVCYADC